MDQRRPVICLPLVRLTYTTCDRPLVHVTSTLMIMLTAPYITLIHGFTCFLGK